MADDIKKWNVGGVQMDDDDGSSGGGGVSSYKDLTDAPVNIVEQPSYSQDDAVDGATGYFGTGEFVKVSDDVYTLNDLLGAEIKTESADYIAGGTNTFDITTTMTQVGATGSNWIVMSPSGNWMQSSDIAVMSCDGEVNFDSEVKIVFTPGTWIRKDVTSMSLPEKMVVSKEFEQALMPSVTDADNRKAPMVVNGKWTLSAQSPLTGISDYRNLKRILKSGAGDTLFPVWSQIRVPHKEFGEIVFDVVNHERGKVDSFVTLLMNDLHDGFEFDATEALCVCPEGLAAGTYATNNYKFTITQAVPANGVLVIGLNGQYQPATISSYASISSLEAIETVDLAEASGDETSLDTTVGSENMNNFIRAQYGNGNYAQSAIHKWLNASGKDWWEPSHKFDRPPSYVNKEGFMGGFDEGFLAILNTTTQTTATNSLFEIDYETNSSYTTSGKFFLPSITQMCGDKNNNVDEGSVFDAFTRPGNNTAEKRVKYLNGQPWYYWERSCYSGNPDYAGGVRSDGYSGYGSLASTRSYGFAAACEI